MASALFVQAKGPERPYAAVTHTEAPGCRRPSPDTHSARPYEHTEYCCRPSYTQRRQRDDLSFAPASSSTPGNHLQRRERQHHAPLPNTMLAILLTELEV